MRWGQEPGWPGWTAERRWQIEQLTSCRCISPESLLPARVRVYTAAMPRHIPPASRGPARCTCRCHRPARRRGSRSRSSSTHEHASSSAAFLAFNAGPLNACIPLPPSPPPVPLLACRLMTTLLGHATAAPTASGMPAPMAPPAKTQAWQARVAEWCTGSAASRGRTCSRPPSPSSLCWPSLPSPVPPHPSA